MAYKFIQVNMYKGKYLNELIQFLTDEDPDFISLQEVSGGADNLCEDRNISLFVYLKDQLSLFGSEKHDYDLIDVSGYMGNAVLSKHKLIDTKVIPLKSYVQIDLKTSKDQNFWPNGPRHLLDCTFTVDGSYIHAMSVHGAWTAPPADTDETLRQAGIIADYLKNTNEPFLLGGDFNNVIQSKTIGLISEVSNNFLLNSGILETTNPKVHKIAPRGYLIDFIFASRDIKLKKLTVPRITVSDHLPVIAEVEVYA